MGPTTYIFSIYELKFFGVVLTNRNVEMSLCGDSEATSRQLLAAFLPNNERAR